MISKCGITIIHAMLYNMSQSDTQRKEQRGKIMFSIEFHARDGGKDAELFCGDLATAVQKYSNNQLMIDNSSTRVITLNSAFRL